MPTDPQLMITSSVGLGTSRSHAHHRLRIPTSVGRLLHFNFVLKRCGKRSLSKCDTGFRFLRLNSALVAMRIQVLFNGTPVVVPCGDGKIPVRDLIEKAVQRYKKLPNKVRSLGKTVCAGHCCCA